MRKYKHITTWIIIFILISGCVQSKTAPKTAPKTKVKEGALLGAVLGGAVGLLSSKKNRAKNMLIGGVIGSLVGGSVGYNMKKQAKSIASAFDTTVDNDPNSVKDINKKIIISNTEKYVKVMFRDSRMFKTNMSIPTHLAKSNIKIVASILTKYPSTIIEIIGHTDNRGNYKYNLDLSTNRAYSVEKILKNEIKLKNQIFSRGCSYSKPIVENTSPENMSLNRRVEIFLYQDSKDIIETPCK